MRNHIFLPSVNKLYIQLSFMLPVEALPGSAVDVSIVADPAATSSLACRARFSSMETLKARANSGSSFGSTPNSKPPPPLAITAPAPSSP